MNITDFQITPISLVYRTVLKLALRHQLAPVEGEVIGLLPEAACERDSEWMRQLTGFDPATKILERCLAAPQPWPGDA
jgi:glutamate formiminotransferase